MGGDIFQIKCLRSGNGGLFLGIIYDLIRNNTQTAVTNIRYKRILFEIIFYLTFRMLLHTSSEVTVNTKLEKLQNYF